MGLLFGIGYLTYGSFASGDHYGWGNAVFDYASVIYALKEDDGNKIDYVIDKLSTKEKKRLRMPAITIIPMCEMQL